MNRFEATLINESLSVLSLSLSGTFQGGVLLARLVKCLTENFASEERAQEVETFFKDKDISGAERTLSQSIETIRLNATWLQRDLPNITDYLDRVSNRS